MLTGSMEEGKFTDDDTPRKWGDQIVVWICVVFIAAFACSMIMLKQPRVRNYVNLKIYGHRITGKIVNKAITKMSWKDKGVENVEITYSIIVSFETSSSGPVFKAFTTTKKQYNRALGGQTVDLVVDRKNINNAILVDK
ncbi:MAG: hypothetical protein ABSH12_02105 [Endomicrobiales bacterium]|jgi:hypothetical protein